MDLVTSNGMNVFSFAADWADLEPSPGVFALHDPLVNPLTLLLPDYPQIKGVTFVLKMIDTNTRPMPPDLRARSFGDPEVVSRFEALIDAIAAEPASGRITHLLLGNEVDGYLSQHPEELPAFGVFYQRAVERIHARLPAARVSTIVTFASLTGHPEVFDRLDPAGDFSCFTYYPTAPDTVAGAWQMRPVAEIGADIDFMARQADGKPFAFTEIGYSASPVNGSSEERQAEFVRAMFRALNVYAGTGRLAFLLYHALYDYPPDACGPYAQAQGVPPVALCSFMGNLGLRRYDTGEAREAWGAFVEGVRSLALPGAPVRRGCPTAVCSPSFRPTRR